jgi:hypothetical protein
VNSITADTRDNCQTPYSSAFPQKCEFGAK